jgi:hypothetical protein
MSARGSNVVSRLRRKTMADWPATPTARTWRGHLLRNDPNFPHASLHDQNDVQRSQKLSLFLSAISASIRTDLSGLVM